MEEDDIFDDIISSHVYINPDIAATAPSEKFDYAENVVNALEEEFKGLSISVPEERKKHKEDLKTKLAILTKQLKSIKNVKNHRMRHINEKNAERRKKLRIQIETIKDDLYAIDLEEKGSEISSTSLVDATVQGFEAMPASKVRSASTSSNVQRSQQSSGLKKNTEEPRKQQSYITASNSNLFGSGTLGAFNEIEFPRLDL